MSTYPKSPKEMTSGMMWFPRMLDKIRLQDRGELTEDYHKNLGEGMDKRCLDFLRVNYADLRERTLAGAKDEELLAWCFEHGRRLEEIDLLVWNSFISKIGWCDHASARLEEVKRELGIADRSDIVTFADLIETDEGRRS